MAERPGPYAPTGGGFVEGDERPPLPDGQGPPPIPKAYLEKLKAAGLRLTKQGKIVPLGKEAGAGAGEMGNAEQLALLQEGYERFGISENPFYDPKRAAFSGQFGGAANGPVFINLGTGLYTTGDQVASDEELALLRARTGYDNLADFKAHRNANTFKLPDGTVYTGGPFQTPESFTAYQTAARANYLKTIQGGGAPRGQGETAPPFDGTQYEPILDGYDTPTLTGLNDTVSKLLQSRQQRERAQSFYGDYFQSPGQEF